MRSLSTGERLPGAARLTVSILSKNGEQRLERLLAEVSQFADQIVVGVDTESGDRTYEIATQFADVVFRFEHGGELSAARMLIFDYADGDWILVLDDDESLEPGLQALLPSLMDNPLATHFWFPRKWIANAEPYEFLFAPPWYPDWQLRLFRNDRSQVWKPARPHSGYHVAGPGLFISQAAILHMERLWCPPHERQAKLEAYRLQGATGAWEGHYRPSDGVPLRPCAGPRAVTTPRRDKALLPPEVRDVKQSASPGWDLEVIEVDMVKASHCGHELVAEVRLRNTGSLAWWPAWGIRSATLYFSHHLLDANCKLIRWDCERTLTLDYVPPGAETTCLHTFRAPTEPGDYILEWDMVSEGERWFKHEARPPTFSPLHVVP